MTLQITDKAMLNSHNSHSIKPPIQSDFAKDFTFQQLISQKSDTTTITTKTIATSRPSDNLLSLGTLSGANKNVAQLLLANPALKAKTWFIIHNPVNQTKAFHKIPSGQEIYFNMQTQEISWPKNRLHSPKQQYKQVSSQQDSVSRAIATPISAAPQKKVLGQLTSHQSTVLSLLAQQDEFRSQRWNIIHSSLNKHKAFTQIPKGATVFIDTHSKEISWQSPDKQMTQPIFDNNTLLARKLDDAVKPFMGTDYKKMDCYTLVVNGLENMGVHYRGKGSLSRQLLQMAQTEGKVNNAYFTGEGITQAMGEKVYAHSITKVQNIEQQSQAIFKDMQALIKAGDILSFSLESKGHTGIISQNQQQWTYINSGRLDHSINDNAPKQGVGEEVLVKEITNWLKRAKRYHESLQITVGRLDSQKFSRLDVVSL